MRIDPSWFRYAGAVMLLCVLVVGGLYSQTERTTYTITGTVIDAKTSEPLIGSSVRIQGTTIGSVADLEGKYAIITTVVPGTYRVAHSFINYKSKVPEVQLGNQPIVEVATVGLAEAIM